MEQLAQELLQRARGNLFDPLEVSEEIVSKALKEARDLTQKKKIPTPNLLDLAMLRLKLLLKVEPSDLDVNLAQSAIKRAQDLRDEEAGMYSFGMRHSIFGRSE